MKKRLSVITLMFISIFTLTSCNNNKFKYIDGKYNIVATTTMIGDLANQIGGDKVNVYTLMKPGVDPHGYTSKPSDGTAFKKADLVISNGLLLEAKIESAIRKLDDKKKLIIGDHLDESKLIKKSSETDPHIWFSVSIWSEAALIVKDKFVQEDPDNKEYYETNYSNYIIELDDLDAYILSKINELDESKRKLITAHDAFSYFGKEYNFEVHGVQGISTESEATQNDIKNIVDLIVEHNVKSIFIESSVSPKTIQAIKEGVTSKGKSVNIPDKELYSDSLGDNQTFIEMYKKNINTIIDNLK